MVETKGIYRIEVRNPVCICCQGEIDAREDSFRATAEAGQLLLDRAHYASEEVKEKLVVLASEKTSLLSMWEERRILYEQCMDLQLFYRDTEQADTWMAKQEVCCCYISLWEQYCILLQFSCPENSIVYLKYTFLHFCRIFVGFFGQ